MPQKTRLRTRPEPLDKKKFMIKYGKITSWNDDKGYGFITPSSGEGQVFAHIRAFKYQARRPEVNRLVTYILSADKQGRICAAEVTMSAAPVVEKSDQGNRAFSSVFAGLLLVVVAVSLYGGFGKTKGLRQLSGSPVAQATTEQTSSYDAVQAAFNKQRSGVQVNGEGVVSKLLADDNDGSRHQRFILTLPSGQTLLVSHNIDLAPRIASLKPGDSVSFNGVYEWNDKGGVIHWTHSDPSGRHEAGWLRHAGQTYQ